MPLDSADLLLRSTEDAHWYAIWTAPRHEKRVAERIRERDLEVLLPVYHSRRQWKKRPVTIVELPLFPGYVFVLMSRSGRGTVLATPGVHSIVGNGKQHIPLRDSEIATLRSGLHLANPEPHPFIASGANVLICRGSLAGLEGVLIRKKGMQRVVIAIESIRRSFSVEVDIADLKVKSPQVAGPLRASESGSSVIEPISEVRAGAVYGGPKLLERQRSQARSHFDVTQRAVREELIQPRQRGAVWPLTKVDYLV